MSKNTQRKDGLFRYWYKGKQFYGKTDQEAKAKRDAYKYECEHGIDRPDPITVFDWVEKWLPVAKAKVTGKTYNEYCNLMEKMTDLVGDKLVSAVTPNDIKNIWKEYADSSDSVIRRARYLYVSCFDAAIDNGYCRTNPCRAKSAKPHRGHSSTHRCLTAEEQNLVLTVPHRCHNAAMIMMCAGLRRGEVLALTKEDIHDNHLWVTKGTTFVHNRPVDGKTKTPSSVRSLPLFEVLKPVYDDMGNYAMPNAKGGQCSETAFKSAWTSYMYHLSKAAGHPVSFTPHDLRHTFVTNGRDAGVDLHVMMAWCGHTTEKMILRIYDHVNADREAQSVDLMNSTVKKQLDKKLQLLEPLKNKGSQAI